MKSNSGRDKLYESPKNEQSGPLGTCPADIKIGVLSDTHGYLDPKILKLFAGVGHILHAGDIGDPFIPFQLEQVAPVTVVLGNNDPGLPFKETETVELAARTFLVHHIVSTQSPSDKVRDLLARRKPDVVVFGHTHKAFCETSGGVLFFNPGYAGKPRFGAERSVAILHCDEKEIRHEFIKL